jgi:hypothetical protein
MDPEASPGIERLDPRPGAAVYKKGVLSLYDPVVLGFSNTYLWRCPTRELLRLYDEHVSDRHLDVGVGSGYFLDRCRFPGPHPTLALLDFSEGSLRFTEHRVRRYAPVSYRADVLQPLDPAALDLAPFRSIGLNYVLHCLPGDLQKKARVFGHLRALLTDDGVLFGSTILGRPGPHGLLARRVMALYNRRGIFSNQRDTREALEQGLAEHFQKHEIRVVGSVALFNARP